MHSEHGVATDARIHECWFLTGPTASGKSQIGIRLARLLDAEIVSLDSMAVYRGMDIGTAKPTPADRRETPHHLIDIRDPTEEFNVSQFLRAARRAIDETRGRDRQVLFVGGTPLYLKAMLRGVFEGPAADVEFRRQVEEEVAEAGLDVLQQRLKQVDPLSAAKLHPHDKRRIIRALEVYKLTGHPISHLQLQFDEGRSAEACRVFQLAWPRAELHMRIDARVDAMFADGLVEEVRNLLAQYGSLGKTASQAVGYSEVIEFLRGEQTLNEMIENVKSRTRQFARRQETWFRSLSECRRVEMSGEFDPEKIAAAIAEEGREIELST